MLVCNAACTVAVPLDNFERCANCDPPKVEAERACEPGYVDCDGEADNGCETFVRSDRLSCGACGNECLYDAACVEGQCSVTTLVTADDTLQQPLIALAASDEHVVMTTDEVVWRLVANGHAEAVFGFIAGSVDVVVSGDRAYWGAENGIHCHPIDGMAEASCAGEILATPDPVVAIALAENSVHYATSQGAIGMFDLQQANAPYVFPPSLGLAVRRLVANAAWRAWTHELVTGTGYGLDTGVAGFTYEPCAISLALAGDSLYFSHATKLMLKDFKSADEPGPIASSPLPIGEVVFDPARNRVLWSDESGSIHALELDDGTTSVLAEHQGPIARLAPNAQGVYFLAGGALHFVQR